MESTRKFLYYILSQYPNRPHGSLNEQLVIGSIKNELHKVCDIVEEQPIKIYPHLSQFKWVIVSLYFAILMITGLLHPLALLIISIIGSICHLLLFDLQVSWVSSILPGIQTTNLFGQINCLEHEHCFNEKTILFVSHTDDCYKQKRTISTLLSISIHWCLYVVCILSCIGYIYGRINGNYLFSPFISIVAMILLVLSMSLYGKGKVNKVSGLTTTSCLLQLSSYFKNNDTSILKTTNIAFLITPIHSDRSEGILSFVKSFSQLQKEQLGNTIVICLDELDDPETITCYLRDGIFTRKYSETLWNSLKDAAGQEDVFLSKKLTLLPSLSSTTAKIFRRYFNEVIPMDAKCHPIKRILREEKEKKVKSEEDVMFIHDDQIDCVNQCVKLLKRYVESIDFVIEMKQMSNNVDNIVDHIELEMNTLEINEVNKMNQFENVSSEDINEEDDDDNVDDEESEDKEDNNKEEESIDIQSLEQIQNTYDHDPGEDSIEL